MDERVRIMNNVMYTPSYLDKNTINMTKIKCGQGVAGLASKQYMGNYVKKESFYPDGHRRFISIMPKKLEAGKVFTITDFGNGNAGATLAGVFDKNHKPIFDLRNCKIESEVALHPLTRKFIKLLRNVKV